MLIPSAQVRCSLASKYSCRSLTKDETKKQQELYDHIQQGDLNDASDTDSQPDVDYDEEETEPETNDLLDDATLVDNGDEEDPAVLNTLVQDNLLHSMKTIQSGSIGPSPAD